MPGSPRATAATSWWYETHDTREAAFQRERRLKEWRRSWKLMLIEEDNPTWSDLYELLNA